ncbi:MAG: cobalt-precorrin-5B (C(1))-methyltransferase CbiD [Thermodesulfobacteriota bacterium]
MAKRLRSGYTTGACAAAAAKAAVLGLRGGAGGESVIIPFPDGSRVRFVLCRSQAEADGGFLASVVKDAGDDPDVTNGAEIVATAAWHAGNVSLPRCVELGGFVLCAGDGVGMVTKPGLPVPVGEPAINPAPRRMIDAAVSEALAGSWATGRVRITIGVVHGEELAAKTLNARLGIVGGLSLLGTTGIVRPVSAEAWTATISASMGVARAAGLEAVVLSTGRTSERAVQELLALPEEGLAMMGDYLEFSLKAAAERGFQRIHLAAMWAKAVKAAMAIPQTHVRHGALEVEEAVGLLARLGVEGALLSKLAGCNTARELYERLVTLGRHDVVRLVCLEAKAYAERTAGLPVELFLVDGHGRVVERV